MTIENANTYNFPLNHINTNKARLQIQNLKNMNHLNYIYKNNSYNLVEFMTQQRYCMPNTDHQFPIKLHFMFANNDIFVLLNAIIHVDVKTTVNILLFTWSFNLISNELK